MKFIQLTPSTDDPVSELWLAQDKIETIATVNGKTTIFCSGRSGEEKYVIEESIQDVLALISQP